MNGMSLLDVLRGVMLDPAEQAVYEADPHAYLEQHGYQDVDDADLSEAFGLVADTLPAEQAQAAFTGEVGPDVPALGEDTSDFDVEPVPDVTADGASPAVDDSDVLDDGADDAADDMGDLGGGGFGDGDGDLDDTPDDGTPRDGADDLDDGALSFGRGEDEGGADAGAAGVDDGGLFGEPALDSGDDIDDAGDDLGAASHDGDADGHDGDGPFGDTGGLDHAGALDDGLDDGTGYDRDIDDADDLPELDGLGAVDNGPDEFDIGSF